MTRIVRPMDKHWQSQLDRDIDRLFGGDEPFDPELVPLMGLVAEIRGLGRIPLPDEFISDHSAVACSTLASRNVASATGPVRTDGPIIAVLRRRVAGAAAGLAMFSAISGVALASDGAMPGDWNYPIDRVLETVGIGDGGAIERLVELRRMNEEGDPVEAILRTAALLGYGPDDPAGAALIDAAVRIGLDGTDPGQSQRVKDQISDLLSYLAENKGNVNGPSVASIANGIGNGPPDNPPGNGPPDNPPGNGNGPPDNPPGNGNGNGPPDNPPGNGNGNGPPDNPPGNGNGKRSP